MWFSAWLEPFLAVFFAFFVQNFIQAIWAENALPFLLVAVVYYALKKGVWAGVVLGFFAGLLMELFGQGPLGAFLMPMVLSGALAGAAAGKLFHDNWLMAILILCAAVCFFMLAQLALLHFQWRA